MTLWKVSADGGNPVQLMHEHAMLPSISPDGRWLCFEYVDGSGTAIMPFDGGPASRLFKVSPPAEKIRFAGPRIARRCCTSKPRTASQISGANRLTAVPHGR